MTTTTTLLKTQDEVTRLLREAHEADPAHLDPDDKARWVADLRSGKWRQARGRLDDGKGGRCCLGVFCESKAKDDGWRGGGSLLGVGVAWASSAIDGFGLSPGTHGALVRLNDSGATFEQIATAIEEVL